MNGAVTVWDRSEARPKKVRVIYPHKRWRYFYKLGALDKRGKLKPYMRPKEWNHASQGKASG